LKRGLSRAYWAWNIGLQMTSVAAKSVAMVMQQ